jgi:DNA repair protein RecN (Recombination protein N)
MLASLRIRNLALVEELEWHIEPGFVAVTGETGSGKSIIVGALKLVLGERADKSLIRSGAESCTVEAMFVMKDAKRLNAWLDEQGIEPCEEGQLIIKRVFATAGTNRQFINGSPTTLAILKELGDGLVDLHGPHDHQSLLANEKQLDLLDSFAGADGLREKYVEQYRTVTRLTTERNELAGSEAALERELDLLRHQVAEIQDAQLRAEEETELLGRYTVASNARRLLEISHVALDRLVESEESALSRLNEVGRQLRELERVDPGANRFADSLTRGLAEIEDLASSLQHYVEELEFEPGELAAMEERVSLLETLKRKYGGSVAEVISFGDKAAARLQKIESRGEEIERLGREIEKLRKYMLETGAKLSEKRTAAAPKLAKSVTGTFARPWVQEVRFHRGTRGRKGAEPTWAGGRGVCVCARTRASRRKPLKSIASSGEISRVMLAVKSSLASQDTIALLVFDEIDANVGGEIAHAVGAKMRAIADERQCWQSRTCHKWRRPRPVSLLLRRTLRVGGPPPRWSK